MYAKGITKVFERFTFAIFDEIYVTKKNLLRDNERIYIYIYILKIVSVKFYNTRLLYTRVVNRL